ncbi:Trk system potassium transporter TrkA, partial [Staphylococcus equorum]|uniref:TrkA C-terminal domain-containing protein n=1 Tax=Staphylococcus equorum TaxID=246432 RepID=UPI0022C7E966|nr:Trk system potassium transporter TrkA [Staphylococcus equorum]
MEALFRIADNQVEAIQFRVPEDSKVTNRALEELKMNDNLLIAYIIRGKKTIFPSGKDDIRAGDQVIIVSTKKNLDNIE